MDALPSEAKILASLAGSYTAWKWADNRYMLAHDLSMIKRMAPLILEAFRFCKTPGFSVVDLWTATLAGKVNKNKPALIRAETGKVYTFKDIEQLSNQVAQWVVSVSQFKQGSCVALYMENDPVYVAIWLGLAKAGVEVAMLNCNVKTKALVHSVSISGAVGIIYGTGPCAENIANVHNDLRAKGINVFACCRLDEPASSLQESLTAVPNSVDFLGVVASFPNAKVDKRRRSHLEDASHTFGYIYTSGTTGLPKACKVSQLKLLTYSTAMPAYSITANDVIYGSGMPLYHTAANLGVMAMVRFGSTYIVRKKFSASNHWSDCKAYAPLSIPFTSLQPITSFSLL